MLLATDIGNSHTTFGVADDRGWRARWRLGSDAGRTLDEWRLLAVELLARHGLSRADLDGAALCSVVPAMTPVLVALAAWLAGADPLVVGPGVRTGLEVRYRPPTALGPDRLVDAVAAVERFGAPVVVVDLGTATTFNVVDGARRFLGGAIAPGLGTGAAALVAAGARLRAVDLSGPSSPPHVGRSTEQAVRAGVLHGHAGLVSGLLRRIDDELSAAGEPRPTVVATGGWSGRIAPLVGRIDHHVPDLVLDGLRVVAGRQPAGVAR